MCAAGGGNGSFGALEFQLVLLRRMADFQPGMVEEARRELGVDAGAMREANRRWQARVRSGRGRRGAGLLRSVLGVPEVVERRVVGDLECEALRWPVVLWPALRFEAVVAPGGALWNEWLVRGPGGAPAVPVALDALRPWEYTVEEVARAFPARPMEGSAPTRSRLRVAAPECEGGPVREAVAEFTWGLLQEVTVVEGRE
ncbi:hypothetical protein AB0A84_01810 [Streptomyces albidoflavus]|uniref:hypothetical protein n=1 Tax=Streptomyces TaxID=1883 RepID=UPI001A5C1FDE|nr:hypothetical protein [Streptomyces sp. T7(2022)]MBL0779159.1 hypothetical protein [Streptomyces albidoflavus]MCG5119492.1 hypothetical protein [Streptomyces sp. T7(2022)]